MAWAPLSPAFWISPGANSTPLINPSRPWARIFLVNTCWPMSRASGWSRLVLQSCGGAAQGSAPRHPPSPTWFLQHFGYLGTMPEFMRYGWRIDVLLGISFGLAQQLMLVAPAAILYASTASPDSLLQKRAAIAARWMLGLPPIIFGLFHLAAIHVFASIVPQWMPFGYFWAVLTGIAFFLAGSAICSGIMDVLAARLLALMLLLFEGLVEIPPIFIRLHNQATWGAAVYNLAAIGACLIFAEFLASRADRGRIGPAENVAMSRPDPMVA